MSLTHSSEYHPRTTFHKERNANSVFLSEQENFLTSCATNSPSDNNQKHGNTVPQSANSVEATTPGRNYYGHRNKFNHNRCPRRARADGHREMDNIYSVPKKKQQGRELSCVVVPLSSKYFADPNLLN
jgi:hypothetical protein